MMIKTDYSGKRKRVSVFTIAVCFFLYLLFSFSSWHEPVMGDEVGYVLFVNSLNDNAIARFFWDHNWGVFGNWHPPAYGYILAAIGRMFGLDEFNARIVGILSFLLSLMMIYLLVKQLVKTVHRVEHIALAACFLFAVNPLAIRGSLLIDMDGTILNLAMMCLLYFFSISRYENMGFRNLTGLGILVSAVLWIKFATPLIFIFSLFFYQILIGKYYKAVQVAKVAILGASIFLFTWFIYCVLRAANFSDIFLVPVDVIRGLLGYGHGLSDWISYLRNALILALWTSPMFILLGAFFSVEIFKRKHISDNFLGLSELAFYGLIVLVVYVFVGGSTHAFPKYHYALVPIFAIVIAYNVIVGIAINMPLFGNMLILLLSLVLYNLLLVQDPLYTLNYALKEAVIQGGGVSGVLKKFLIQMAFVALAVPLVLVLLRKQKKPILLSSVMVMAAGNISLSLIQSKADYNTVYCYGAKGVRAAADFVRSKTDNLKPIIAPPEILFLANSSLLSYVLTRDMEASLNADLFLHAVKSRDIDCVVYGISGNTLAQYRALFFVDKIQRFLRENYSPYELGSYNVWVRKTAE